MAIKLHLNGSINYRKPLSDEKYDKNELALELHTVPENIRFLDMGPFVLVVNEEEKTLNSVASIYFRFKVNGDVLLIAGKELAESSFLTEENTKYEIEDVEAGVLKSIKDTILVYQMVMNNDPMIPEGKSVYYYDPERNDETPNETERAFTIDFYKSAYETIKKFSEIDSNLKLADLVLLEDKDLIIKFPPDINKIESIFKKIINYFISLEEYEKCEILKKTLINLKNNEKLI